MMIVLDYRQLGRDENLPSGEPSGIGGEGRGEFRAHAPLPFAARFAIPKIEGKRLRGPGERERRETSRFHGLCEEGFLSRILSRFRAETGLSNAGSAPGGPLAQAAV